jgi:predicted CoA-substrate-specific enzyme activase
MDLYYLGIDIGSTTVKTVLTDGERNIVFERYTRHYADIKTKLRELLNEAQETVGNCNVKTVITGSGGMQLADGIGVQFVQEVVASTKAVKTDYPQTDVAIELGGEDAKITYFKNGTEQRMNGTCAGGTGSFIDQMASLLQTDAQGLNELAKKHHTIYPIAARCGVFAKTDVQPLINEGVAKEDIAASVLQAVVIQTISGLACGRPIRGNIAFLGGPLYFLSELRNRFIETLKLTEEQIVFPPHSQLFVAIGAALLAEEEPEFLPLDELIHKMKTFRTRSEIEHLPALFADENEYEVFRGRHARDTVQKKPLETHHSNCYLGIDAGSTTTKLALIDDDGARLYSYYAGNHAAHWFQQWRR